jgi:hypothetical protein
MPSLPRIAAAIAAALAVAGKPAACQADVLYDTLWITDQIAYEDGIGNMYGGFGVFSWWEDWRLADDFFVDGVAYPQGIRLTTLITDSTTVLGNPPAEGVIVRVLIDDDGHPGATVYERQLPPEAVISIPFEDPVFGGSGFAGQRLVIDASGEDLVLPPGRYWLNTQPVDLTVTGDVFFQLRDLDTVIDADTHAMNTFFGEFWAPVGDYWNWGAGTAAMRIEAEAIPAPAAVPLLALAGLAVIRRGR